MVFINWTSTNGAYRSISFLQSQIVEDIYVREPFSRLAGIFVSLIHWSYIGCIDRPRIGGYCLSQRCALLSEFWSETKRKWATRSKFSLFECHISLAVLVFSGVRVYFKGLNSRCNVCSTGMAQNATRAFYLPQPEWTPSPQSTDLGTSLL